MSETGSESGVALGQTETKNRVTEVQQIEARRLRAVSDTVWQYAEGLNVSTELIFEFSRFHNSVGYNPTDKYRGWKLGAEGTKPNTEPNYREGVSLLIGRGLQFFVFREPLDESVPVYKPEGFNMSDLVISDILSEENDIRMATQKQAMLDRMKYGRYSGYHAVLESLLDFADQHELIVPPIDQLLITSD